VKRQYRRSDGSEVRYRRVARLRLRGLSNVEIAQQLGLPYAVVKASVQNARRFGIAVPSAARATNQSRTAQRAEKATQQ
jgi:transposase